ncbi:hypothetical protein AB6A23_25205 [Paenibacillus tarimensis]
MDKGCRLTLTQEIEVPHKVDAPVEQVRQMLASYKKSTEHGWCKMFNQLDKLF